MNTNYKSCLLSALLFITTALCYAPVSDTPCIKGPWNLILENSSKRSFARFIYQEGYVAIQISTELLDQNGSIISTSNEFGSPEDFLGRLDIHQPLRGYSRATSDVLNYNNRAYPPRQPKTDYPNDTAYWKDVMPKIEADPVLNDLLSKKSFIDINHIMQPDQVIHNLADLESQIDFSQSKKFHTGLKIELNRLLEDVSLEQLSEADSKQLLSQKLTHIFNREVQDSKQCLDPHAVEGLAKKLQQLRKDKKSLQAATEIQDKSFAALENRCRASKEKELLLPIAKEFSNHYEKRQQLQIKCHEALQSCTKTLGTSINNASMQSFKEQLKQNHNLRSTDLQKYKNLGKTALKTAINESGLTPESKASLLSTLTSTKFPDYVSPQIQALESFKNQLSTNPTIMESVAELEKYQDAGKTALTNAINSNNFLSTRKKESILEALSKTNIPDSKINTPQQQTDDANPEPSQGKAWLLPWILVLGIGAVIVIYVKAKKSQQHKKVCTNQIKKDNNINEQDNN